MYSLRRALAVRYSVTMFVALVAIACWAWLGTSRLLRQELDRGIAAAAELEAAALAAGRAPATHATISSTDAFIRRLNRFVVLREADGSVLAVNTPFALDLPADTSALARARAAGSAWADDDWNGTGIRSYFVRAPRGSPDRAAVLQVSAALEPLDHVTGQVLVFMLGTVLLGTVATMFGASWLARSAVRPVHEIASEADAVTPGTVGQRITTHGDVEEFQQLIGVLNRMLERLDRALLAERRIIRDTGHDLRTPITAIQGEIEVILRRPRSPDEYQRALRSILEEAEQLGALSESLHPRTRRGRRAGTGP